MDILLIIALIITNISWMAESHDNYLLPKKDWKCTSTQQINQDMTQVECTNWVKIEK